jgi:hypothetical protein
MYKASSTALRWIALRSARQRIAIDVTRREIILCAVPHRLRRGFVAVAENQNRDVGHGAE